MAIRMAQSGLPGKFPLETQSDIGIIGQQILNQIFP